MTETKIVSLGVYNKQFSDFERKFQQNGKLSWPVVTADISLVRYSGEMEPNCAKTILIHLSNGPGLQIDSLTADRSTTMPTKIKALSPEVPALHPPIKLYFDIMTHGTLSR